MPNAFPIRRVGLGAAAAAQLVQSVKVPALTVQLPTPSNLMKLSAADKKSVAIAAGIGGVAAYALGRRAWVAALGAIGGAVYGMYRVGSGAPAVSTTALPPATTDQFVATVAASQPAPVVESTPTLNPPQLTSPVTAPAPAPPPGAASAPAPSPPPQAPADPSVVSTLDPPELTDDIEG
jgi:hypothetical protein